MILKRFMSSYPYLLKPEQSTEILKSFPVSFGCKLNLPASYSQIQEIDQKYEVIVKKYENLVNCLTSGNFEKLEDSVEHNFLKKLQASRLKLEANNLKLKKTGSIEKTEVYCVHKEIFIGCILPFRNLFLPDEEYEIYTSRFIKDNFRNVHVSVASQMPLRFNFHELEHFDFSQANREPPPDAYKNLSDFHQITNLIKLEAENQEFIIQTGLKLVVVNKEGQVVSGNDGDLFEVHSGIIERFRFFPFNYKIFTSRTKKADVLYQRVLKGFLNNNIMVDFDGFMERNPPVPKHLLI